MDPIRSATKPASKHAGGDIAADTKVQAPAQIAGPSKDRLERAVGREGSAAKLPAGLRQPGSASPAVEAGPNAMYAAMDAEKARLIAHVRSVGTLDAATEVAGRIAELHGKPRHADEVHTMADRLIPDESQRSMVKLAATLVVLGEWQTPAKIMLGGRLSDDEKRQHIFPINARACEVLRQISGAESIADAIDGKQAEGITPLLHACRDIAALDAPRRWRADEKHPDGRLHPAEIATELRKNNAREGRDADVTEALLARYETARARE